MSIQISASGSLHIRALLKDCAGDLVTVSDVSAIKLNIYERLTPNTSVTDYTNLAIPTTAILTTAATDENGNEYNFDCNPFITGKPMFPKRQTAYVIEVVFYDTDGKPSAHQIEVDAL